MLAAVGWPSEDIWLSWVKFSSDLGYLFLQLSETDTQLLIFTS